MKIAELHAVRREQRPPGMGVVVDYVDRAGSRHDPDHGLRAPGRRERAGEAAAVLLVEDHRERHAGEPRLRCPRDRMMSVSSTTADDRFTLALPRATKIGHGLLG